MSKYKWHVLKGKNTYYAGRVVYVPKEERVNGKRQKTIRMHRDVLKVSQLIDHIDGNGLNNQKNNLRLCDVHQNAMNSRKPKNKSSKYKGVCKIKNKWYSAISYNGEVFRLGSFDSELHAALAYDRAAREYFKEFARLNFSEITTYDDLDSHKFIKSSKYKGVSRISKRKWRVTISIKRKPIYIGHYNSEIEAAKAYNEAVIKYFGESAKLNEIL